MAIKKKLLEIWQKEYNIVSASFCSLILVGIEKIMEVEFKCPPKKGWRISYTLCYFLIPAIILVLLSVAFQSKSCHSYSLVNVIKVFLPPLIWIIILLLDGRYLACLFKTPEENLTTKGTENSSTEQPSDVYIISQIFGLVVILIVVFLFFLYKKRYCQCIKRCEREKAPEQFEMMDTKEKCMQALLTDIVKPRISVWLDRVLETMQKNNLRVESQDIPEPE